MANLIESSREGNLKRVVKLLLEAGANIHVKNEALWEASRNGYTDIVKLLLKAGADVHANHDMALEVACIRNRIEVVKLLLEAGADVHLRDDFPLKWASRHHNIEVVKLLLDFGADKDKISRFDTLEMGEYIPVNPRRIRLIVRN